MKKVKAKDSFTKEQRKLHARWRKHFQSRRFDQNLSHKFIVRMSIHYTRTNQEPSPDDNKGIRL